ncbi:MAG: YqgE/AlgH family protein [Thermodesulfobacteriota bacterium]
MEHPERHEDSLAGQFLIAMPSLDDPNFSTTVTYLCVHNPGGAFGLVVNRVLPGGQISAIMRELDIEYKEEAGEAPIHLGGPVHPGHVFVLHGAPLEWEASMLVSPTVAMTSSRDVLEAIARSEGPESFILVLGCAGWGPGQLEQELAENSWLTCPASDEILFSTPVDERWDKAARKLGIDLQLFNETPGHA